jgi:glycosyltransferase involved in cell wall biosynthesis
VTDARDSPTVGGAWTLATALTSSLKTTRTEHEYVFLDQILQPDDLSDGQGTLSHHILPHVLRQSYRASVRIARKIPLQRFYGKLRLRKTYTERLEETIDQYRIDIVWFLASTAIPPPVPFIATVLDLEHRKQPYFPEVSITGWTWEERERSYRAVLPRASFIITGTQVGKKEIVHYYGVNPDNVKVVPFPVPPREARETPLDSDVLLEKYRMSKDFLLYPAQFWPHKNHINLLKALSIIRYRHGLKLNLALTGSDKGNRQHIQEKIRELELSDQVFDLGFVSRRELNALYEGALALVFPSFFGPDNIPPLEAFALQCPVLASRIAGAEEQLNGAALLFDPTNPVDIADKILALRSDQALRKKLTTEGRQIAQSRSPERYIARIDEIVTGFAAIRECWSRDYRHT